MLAGQTLRCLHSSDYDPCIRGPTQSHVCRHCRFSALSLSYIGAMYVVPATVVLVLSLSGVWWSASLLLYLLTFHVDEKLILYCSSRHAGSTPWPDANGTFPDVAASQSMLGRIPGRDSFPESPAQNPKPFMVLARSQFGSNPVQSPKPTCRVRGTYQVC